MNLYVHSHPGKCDLCGDKRRLIVFRLGDAYENSNVTSQVCWSCLCRVRLDVMLNNVYVNLTKYRKKAEAEEAAKTRT
jgi:hypothetical protein